MGQTGPDYSQVDFSRFRCHRCGHCCHGAGTVQLNDLELDRAAGHLGISHLEFADAYILIGEQWQTLTGTMGLTPRQIAKFLRKAPLEIYRQTDGHFYLKSQNSETKPCILLEDKGCKIHPVKPDQCRTFPMQWRNPDSHQTCQGLRVLLEETPSYSHPSDSPAEKVTTS